MGRAEVWPLGKRAAAVAVVLTVMAAVLFLRIPICPMALALRVPCPGCGMTRATIAAVHGDFHASFHYHPLAMIVVPIVTIAMLRNTIGYLRHGRWGDAEKSVHWLVSALAAVLLVVLLGVWIARFFGAFGGPAPV